MPALPIGAPTAPESRALGSRVTVLAYTTREKSKANAVAKLELLRAGQSLDQLVDELKQRR